MKISTGGHSLVAGGQVTAVSEEEESLTRAHLASLRGRLLEWLLESAYPLWSARGIDPRDGGFVEMLNQDATVRVTARRLRVQPRQVFCFAHGRPLGWHGDSTSIVSRGIDYIDARYRRRDGLFRTMVGVDGDVIDDRALLYDQAFVLLGLASAAVTLDRRAEFERRALQLRDRLERRWRLPAGGFLSGETGTEEREANPHMHLLEACLAWAQIGNDPGWQTWTDDLANLAVERFVNPTTGVIPEAFNAAWGPAPEIAGRLIEPGHQFEWAWLLLRAAKGRNPDRRAVALRLIAVAEREGVFGGVAINSLTADFNIHDANARLWPQTERLKAALLAAEVTGDPAHSSTAVDAAESLMRYLETEIPGLWFDVRRPDRQMVNAPAPASTFYHLISAITVFAASSC